MEVLSGGTVYQLGWADLPEGHASLLVAHDHGLMMLYLRKFSLHQKQKKDKKNKKDEKEKKDKKGRLLLRTSPSAMPACL